MDKVIKKKKTIGASLWKVSRDKLEAAYIHYLEDPVGNQNEFFQDVLRFALSKVSYIDHSFKTEACETPDDLAQEVTVYVWQHLCDFRGGPESFYPWLHRICFISGINAYSRREEIQNDRVELFTPSTDDEEGFVEENPLLQKSRAEPGVPPNLPSSIKGVDRQILQMMLVTHMSQKEVAETLGITVRQVEHRLKLIKKRVGKNAQSN